MSVLKLQMTADEAQEAEALIKDMKSKHRHKQREVCVFPCPYTGHED